MGQGKRDPRESNSPILYADISSSYLRAFTKLWEAEFGDMHRFYWDKSLIFHPISQLLGIALETALKGLLVCRGKEVPRGGKGHDLENLLKLLEDQSLEDAFADALGSIAVPRELFECNPSVPKEEIERMYRRHHVHFHLLNLVYDRPFAARYPVLGGQSLPDPTAVAKIVGVLHATLDEEKKNWRPGK